MPKLFYFAFLLLETSYLYDIEQLGPCRRFYDTERYIAVCPDDTQSSREVPKCANVLHPGWDVQDASKGCGARDYPQNIRGWLLLRL